MGQGRLLSDCYTDTFEIWYLKSCDHTNARAYAESQIKPDQWICLDELWDRESSWKNNPRAHLSVNRSSGAYGIPQALPAIKMQETKSNWRWNYYTQIDWGLKYIKDRYGDACSALAHHFEKHWY